MKKVQYMGITPCINCSAVFLLQLALPASISIYFSSKEEVCASTAMVYVGFSYTLGCLKDNKMEQNSKPFKA